LSNHFIFDSNINKYKKKGHIFFLFF